MSPYYNPNEALHYFDELITRYPHTPWAVQGQAWITLLNAQHTLEETRRRLQADLRTREATIRSRETVLRTKDTAMRSKDATIRSLREQLDRTRDIDAQIDQKERELLR
jgi:outer membrane protein assembly factor BamD (BamD/ComL family)